MPSGEGRERLSDDQVDGMATGRDVRLPTKVVEIGFVASSAVRSIKMGRIKCGL